ncbi:sensor histidine kinase [Alkalicoccobacillus murimartini]|uniref:histidine kinase n=1 Tax=Alkalicoccobacillus murimartini TaxID=171685 RepID=A0ABT9YMW8_9BACI|nr:sensor histidine kinase [Alkalicoccobacillus murimartini]MDQ0208349.1 signal transduction histidine kinase [Alkalicoccobacillus murimartini]
MKFIFVAIAVSFIFSSIEQPELIQSYEFWFGMGIFAGMASSRPLWQSVSMFYSILAFIYSFFHFIVLSDGMVTPYFIYSILAIAVSFEDKKSYNIPLYLLGLFLTLHSFYFIETISFSILMISHYILLLFALLSIKKLTVQNEEYIQEKQTYLIEYRTLNRQLREQELNTAAKERNRIARDLHDSVGHQLTALMMQLQVIEMQLESMPEQQKLIKQTKDLARNSLKEMRESVKALQKDSIKGLEAVIQLIRKLEAESHVRIQMVTKPGAMSVVLNDEQSVAVYRFIQEGLTNAMRHASSREVEVTLEILGEHSYVMKMSNRIHQSSQGEGFGLRNLRTRFISLDGRFSSGVRGDQFVIEGVFPLIKREIGGS